MELYIRWLRHRSLSTFVTIVVRDRKSRALSLRGARSKGCTLLAFFGVMPAVHIDSQTIRFVRSQGVGHAAPVSNPRSVLTQKCVVEDRRGQAERSAAEHFVVPENPALAEDRALLLAGNLLRHLKDHLNQPVLR